MYLIVGLGNPEKKYEKTFHNMGFLAAGDAAEALNTKFKKKECEASVAEAFVYGEKVVIARPMMYMNASGRADKQLMAKYKVSPHEMVVLYDDYELFSAACHRAAEAALALASGEEVERVMTRYNG